MNFGYLILWGFAATMVLTVIMAGSRPLGFTRIDLPFLLGTMFTANRNKAPWLGFLVHIVIGWIFAFIYGAAFESSGLATWWFGIAISLVHVAVVLSIGLEIVAYFHPRMARPYQGPTPTKQLEPPGFFALNYGRGTPLVTIIGHLIYGGILGAFYVL
ncbi:hypothetical protein [Adhaeribacter soli]|uniref:Uncharacterized protein n=1 Tax=Adhaeribacter soli TaxID=2607655 RepID=A0A5N1IS22_9BACT|nr:hypothetical protein [Adhaeribacter soli]KAA9332810.1 hypothetical protein F0P94_12505 [Adhaeribacter soli]